MKPSVKEILSNRDILTKKYEAQGLDTANAEIEALKELREMYKEFDLDATPNG